MDTTPELAQSIQFIKGVGPKLAKVFSKKGIQTLEDALYFLPRAYQDRSTIVPIAQLRVGEEATVLAEVVSFSQTNQGRKKRTQAIVKDESGNLILNWFFGYPSLKADFTKGQKILLHGEVRAFGGVRQITHPDYELVDKLVDGRPRASANFGRIVPVYSETEGLHQKTLRRIMGEVLRVCLPELEDPLPQQTLKRLHFPTLRQSFANAHFPPAVPTEKEKLPGIQRIIFEEFFVLQLGLGLRRQRLQKQRAPQMSAGEEALKQFIASLPFSLTDDQNKAITEIVDNLKKNEPMARLLQGDVGAGKTVVAFATSVVAAANGYQTAIMAPTEVLAQQHFKTASAMLSKLGLRVQLMTQGTKRSDVETSAHVYIGTHALFQKDVSFNRLGLVIVDEQHRFGVEQRNRLIKKGNDGVPHLLMMTATPIPRSLSLTLYGDLDLTLLRQKPAGRQPIRTRIVRDKERPRLYETIRARLKSGQQAYVIYPLVEASEKLELKSATEMYEKLAKEVFPEFRVALLHGRLSSEEKDNILKKFKEHAYDLLVSTTVIEVGIDVANATLMVIEHPERLGLSQLHQLRGRVGRGSLASECLLVAEHRTTPRLRVMVDTDDGFVIAEEDLKLRGPGEFLGTRQHGLPGFRVGNILRDLDLLVVARKEAQRILDIDPTLSLGEHQAIARLIEGRWGEKLARLRSG